MRRQASALFSADDDSLIIHRKAEGATSVQIARELRIERPNAQMAVNNRWRSLRIRGQSPLPVGKRVLLTAELARRIFELRMGGKSFREIAVLEGSSISRVKGIFNLYGKKWDPDGKRIALDDVLPNANSEQTHTPLEIKSKIVSR
ncbi:hypothetical protein AC578_2506 [Pseudocercospora eumusae]|uniref:Uncharacterized protein n=1 Tax=Pseudocercospora eumusae TaxID=321146 RepID=A0A139HY41_9PEZI|nr:hypothetical protein AC578_2506 [Pseudocercospora eumusae]